MIDEMREEENGAGEEFFVGLQVRDGQIFRSKRLFLPEWISSPPNMFEANTRKISRQISNPL